MNSSIHNAPVSNYGTIDSDEVGQIKIGRSDDFGYIENHGLIRASNGGSVLVQGNWTNMPGGQIEAAAGSTLTAEGNWTNEGAIRSSGGILNLGGTCSLRGGRLDVSSDGVIVVGSGAGQSRSGSVSVCSNGVLVGNGDILGSLDNKGVITPGHSPGRITVTGDYAQSGLLEIEVFSLSEHDELIVGGAASLGGTLQLILPEEAFFGVGDTFDFLVANSVSGEFGEVIMPTDSLGNPIFDLSYGSDYVRLTALQTVPEPASMALLSLGAMALLRKRRS